MTQEPQKRFQLLPVDQGASDRTFEAFRADLITAVKIRNAAFVIDAAVPALQQRLQRLLSSTESAAWRELERLLSLGGSFTTTRGNERGRREFCAPYTYSEYPKPVPEPLSGEVDPWVVLGRGVVVRAERSVDAPVVRTLTHDLVKAHGGYDPDPNTGLSWVGVELPDGQEGWVLASQIRDPTDYHACFARIDGRWRMTTFDRGLVPW